MRTSDRQGVPQKTFVCRGVINWDQPNQLFYPKGKTLLSKNPTPITLTLENLLAWNKCPLTLYNFLHLLAPLLYMFLSSPTHGMPGDSGIFGNTENDTKTQ